jgi:hypothetical protein
VGQAVVGSFLRRALLAILDPFPFQKFDQYTFLERMGNKPSPSTAPKPVTDLRTALDEADYAWAMKLCQAGKVDEVNKQILKLESWTGPPGDEPHQWAMEHAAAVMRNALRVCMLLEAEDPADSPREL